MRKMKNRVLFFTDDLENAKVQQFYQIDFKIIKDNGYELTITDNWIELFKVWKYDILFQYFYTRSFYRSIPFYFARKRIFYTGGIDSLNRTTTPTSEYYKQKFLFWLCYQLATLCIIVSDTDWSNILLAYNGKLQRKLVKSYHTIDVEKFFANVDNKEKLFLTICWQGSNGNINRKGVDKSLELFKYLSTKTEFKDYKYIIVGKEGPGTPYLLDIIKSYQLVDKVILTGAVVEEDKVDYLKRSKYYFQLSYYEGFGLAALEAEASKNIIIHSGCGGLRYVIGENGILVNINKIDKEFDRVYKEIISFDDNKLTIAFNRVREEFQYNKRKQQFADFFLAQ